MHAGTQAEGHILAIEHGIAEIRGRTRGLVWSGRRWSGYLSEISKSESVDLLHRSQLVISRAAKGACGWRSGRGKGHRSSETWPRRLGGTRSKGEDERLGGNPDVRPTAYKLFPSSLPVLCPGWNQGCPTRGPVLTRQYRGVCNANMSIQATAGSV